LDQYTDMQFVLDQYTDMQFVLDQYTDMQFVLDQYTDMQFSNSYWNQTAGSSRNKLCNTFFLCVFEENLRWISVPNCIHGKNSHICTVKCVINKNHNTLILISINSFTYCCLVFGDFFQLSTD
jgi:hypothetical protein